MAIIDNCVHGNNPYICTICSKIQIRPVSFHKTGCENCERLLEENRRLRQQLETKSKADAEIFYDASS